MIWAETPITPAGVASAAHCSPAVRPKSTAPSSASNATSRATNHSAIAQRIVMAPGTCQYPSAQRQTKNPATSITGTSANVAAVRPKCGAT